MEVASRAVDRVTAAIAEFVEGPSAGATAGVATWTDGCSPSELVSRADRALLHAKQTGQRGGVHPFTAVPQDWHRGRFGRGTHEAPAPSPPMTAEMAERDERLRKRTRQLGLANALGARLAGMTDVQGILEATVEELHRAFGYFLCAVIRDHGDGERQRGRGPGRRLRPPRRPATGASRATSGLIGRCLTHGAARARQRRHAGARATTRRRRPSRCARSSSCPLWSRRRAVGRDQHRGARARRLRRGRRAARGDRRRPGRRGAALRLALRAARARLPRHGGGAGRRAGGQGRLHRRARALDRRAGGGRSAAPLGHGRRRPARPALRRGLPRHRQDRHPGGDPLQARPAHRRGARRSWRATP